ncbi:MAG: prenyltransferase/squalene oxidase repeat-containing protein [Gemmataceae bacterium]
MRPAILLLTASVLAAGPGKKDAVKMPDSARKATSRALAWLAARQNGDGSWSEARYPHNPAITSFALLAFLSQGHLPNQGIYGKEIARGVRYLVSSQREDDGYIIGTRGGNMYSHGMAALVLAEVYGLTNDKTIRPALKKAVELIVGGQNRDGGWRYTPQPRDADVSVTIMQVMALRAAKNAGLHVKDETMRDAIDYIKRCYDDRSGGFCYMPGMRPGFARTAAGVCVLQLTGEYKASEIPRAVDYLKDNFDAREHYWYGHYYASHAMHQVGGREWKAWYERMLESFLPMQSADGSWSGYEQRGSPGPVYQTAIAVIALSVPMNYLPIYQR